MIVELRRAARGLADIVYPRRAICAGCGDRSGLERDWLCLKCRMALAERWIGAMPPPPGGLILGASAAYHYGGPASGMVRRLKYGGAKALAEPMGRHMARAMEGLRRLPADCVVPVPMHKKRLAERGFNHAGELAKALARELGLPVAEALMRLRDTPQQARLSDAERLGNMDGAFAAKPGIPLGRVLLVDDVVTTGATANACARALIEGGAEGVVLVCFAAARDKREDA